MTRGKHDRWLWGPLRRLWIVAGQRQLHIIVAVLSFLAVFSAISGGYLYYDSLSYAAHRRSQQAGELRLSQLTKQVSYALLEKVETVRAMAGMAAFRQALREPSDLSARVRANELLVFFADALAVDVCYLMTLQGDTIASSNHNAPDSFVGINFGFRPYFYEGLSNPPATYLALGVTSNKRGVYHSYPVRHGDTKIGVVVLKKNVDLLERDLPLDDEEYLLVTDPHGVVFISNVPAWRFGSLHPLDAAGRASLVASRQLGRGPWPWIGLQEDTASFFVNRDGRRHEVFRSELTAQPGWHIYYLHREPSLLHRGLAPFVAPTGIVILLLCGTVGVSVALLYRKARREILRRRDVEKALRNRILDRQEEERATLARELHDELGQNLTALRLESVWLRARLDPSDELAQRRVSEMCELIDQTIEDVRGLAFRLRPEILDDLGLVDALDLCAVDFERRTGIPCVFQHQGALALLDSVATVAYRITQEALTNVARHADANHVEVSLQTAEDRLRLEVLDDGCGFAPDDDALTTGFGLAGMRERASLVGGTLRVESDQGAGTRVSFAVELPAVSGEHQV